MNKKIQTGLVLLMLAAVFSACTSGNQANQPSGDTEEIPVTENTWLKIFGTNSSDIVQDVLETEDGGFLFLWTTFLNWETTEGSTLTLTQIDERGEVIWENTFSGEPYINGNNMIFTPAGTILISGESYIDETNRRDVFIMELDMEGNLLQSKTFGGPMDEWVSQVVVTNDGGYAVFGNIVDPDDYVTNPGAAGYGGFENRSSPYLMLLDQNLDEISFWVYDNLLNTMIRGGGQTAEGNFFLISSILYFPELGDDLYLLMVDAEGERLWSRTWEQGGITPRSFQVTQKGNLLIGGLYSESGDPRNGDADCLLVEVDLEGNEIWSTVVGDPDMVDLISGLVATPDGGYLIVVDRTADLYHSTSTLHLIKLDQDREVQWEADLGQSSHYMISALLLLDDGYLVAASYQIEGTDLFDFELIKTDINGDFSN